MIQLAYYSLIPIDIYCDPFRRLTGLKYSSGLTPLPYDLPQNFILFNYSIMGLKFNFLSNVNFLLMPLIIVPLLSYPIIKIGNKSNDPHTKPRCKRYGKSLIFEVPLVTLLFNSFNIYTSLGINIQFFSSSIVSLLCCVIAALLLPAFIIIFVKYN